MSALADAHDELVRRLQAADRHWAEYAVLGSLVTVADHVKRVGDHPTPHYRADKAGPLLVAAIRLQRAVFLAYAGWPEDSPPAERQIEDAVAALGKAADAVRTVLWQTADAALHNEPLGVYRSTAREVTATAAAFSRWAKTVAEAARPDPETDW